MENIKSTGVSDYIHQILCRQCEMSTYDIDEQRYICLECCQPCSMCREACQAILEKINQ